MAIATLTVVNLTAVELGFTSGDTIAALTEDTVDVSDSDGAALREVKSAVARGDAAIVASA